MAHGCLNAFANAKGTVFSIHHAEAASLIFFKKRFIVFIDPMKDLRGLIESLQNVLLSVVLCLC